jgi:Secretion system C-terminal sorting domain
MKILILFILSFSVAQYCNSQSCGDGPMSYATTTVTFGAGSTNSSYTLVVTAQNAISNTSGIFGSVWIKTVSGVNLSISGASSTGLTLTQTIPSEALSLPAGHTYHWFSSIQVLNPSTLFPLNTPVTVGTISSAPASTPEIVMTDLAPPADNMGLYLYYRTALQVSNDCKFEDNLIQAQGNILLPIHLSTFSATKHAERSSKLNWKTSSEINSDYFDIERSQDGNTWETIGRVSAAGNSSSELTYAYIDDKLPLLRSKEQLFYYRLRMTDLDGTFKYSDIRGVNFGKLSEGVVSIYPNPTVEHINVDLSGMDLEAGNVDLFVYDMTGRQMIKKSIIGNGIELIDVTLLPASTYNVVVKQGATTYQQRVIKID